MLRGSLMAKIHQDAEANRESDVLEAIRNGATDHKDETGMMAKEKTTSPAIAAMLASGAAPTQEEVEKAQNKPDIAEDTTAKAAESNGHSGLASYDVSAATTPSPGLEGGFVQSLKNTKNDGWSMSAYTQPPHSLGGPMSKPKK